MDDVAASEQAKIDQLLTEVLRQTPRDLWANARTRDLVRLIAIIFPILGAVFGGGIWIGDELASRNEASLKLQNIQLQGFYDTAQHDLGAAKTEFQKERERGDRLEATKRNDEIFLTTYLRYLMSLHGLTNDSTQIARCQFVNLQVDMFKARFGPHLDPDALQKQFGDGYRDAKVPVPPYGDFRIPTDVQDEVVRRATGAGSSGNTCGA
jgi:hypothetical protein